MSKKRNINRVYSFGVLAVAGIFAIGANATNLLATTEYANFSIRGKSELTFNPDGSKIIGNSAMSKDISRNTVMELPKVSILLLQDFLVVLIMKR